MSNKIAVVADPAGQIGSIGEESFFDLYAKGEDREWRLLERVRISVKDWSDMERVRSTVRRAASELSDCRILLGKKVSGVAYHILDRLGFYIFEADTFYPKMFDEITAEVEQIQKEAKGGGAVPLSPYSPKDDGIYYLDLVALQEKHPEISSKKALSQFLNNEVFLRLELICRHLPPWVEGVVERRRLKCTIEKQGEDICRVVFLGPRC